MSGKHEEHQNRLGIIARDDTMLHDYNLMIVMFPDLDPYVVSAKVLEVRRMDSPTLSHRGWRPGSG